MIDAFLAAALAAGWREWMGPKWHWMVHYSEHLQRWGCLLTCWAHERKHKVVKRYATQINNSRAYEQSVLSEVISHYLNDLRSPGHFRKTAYLEEPHKANAKLLSFLIRELEMNVDPDSCDQSSC